MNIFKATNPSNLLRMFATLALILLVTILLLNGLVVRKIYNIHNTNDAKHAALSVSRILFEQKKEILSLTDSDGERSLNVKSEHVPELDEYVLTYMAPFDIMKIKIFSKDKRIVYSTDHSIIGQIDANNEKLKRALKGEIISQIEKKGKIWDLAGEEQYDLDIAETYLPVWDNNVIVGSFEIYTDITRSKSEISSILKSSLVVFTVVMILALGLLYLLMRSGTTQLSKNEELLRESEESFRSVAETANDAITSIDSHEKIIFWNHAAENIFGHKIEEAVGKSVTLIIPERFHKNHKKGLERFIKTGKPKVIGETLELVGLRKDGSEFPLELTISNWEIKDKIVFTAIIRDTTARKQAEQEKEKLEAQLQQAQKMEAIGTLAGGVAHDFNNILTTIIGYAHLALKEVDKDGPLREEIEEIKIAGERAATLTRQLLAFSRKQIIQPRVLDLNELLTDIEKMFGRLIGEDIELLTIPGPELWQVKADPGQIEQVIMNLVVNAKDAMPKGGKLTVETANMDLAESYFREHGIEAQPGSYVMLAVSDTGSGMNKETQEHIFEPFFTTKEEGKGTGLGLSTVYGIVKQNNGFIWVYSEPEQGTTFKVYLSKAKGDVTSEEKERTFVDDLGGSETVLIVEDDDSLRKLAQKALKQYGYRVLEAENGEDALRVSEAHDGSIDLLITDVVMPKMSGKETAEQLQPLYPHMKVIYMSGYTDNAIVHHGVLKQGLNFLEKPFSPESLAHNVREVLDQK